MMHDYHNAMREEGLMSEFRFLDNSDEFYWVPPGYQSALTYDSVKYIIEDNARAMVTTDFRWKNLKIYPLSKSIANFSGEVSGLAVDTTNIKIDMSIIESGTLIKRKDGWKLLSGQSTILKSTVVED